jgi:TetR/AcrR family tetracycline transcriptional repressor
MLNVVKLSWSVRCRHDTRHLNALIAVGRYRGMVRSIPAKKAKRQLSGNAPRDNHATSERIVRATLRRIRLGGFASVSMRQLADDLGITATALYHHFHSKDELLDAVAERIYDSIPTPDPELHWSGRLRQLVLAQERVNLDHPGLARFLLVRRSESTGAFRWIESILQVLKEGGLTDDESLFGLNQLSFLINPLTFLDVPQRHSSRMTFGSKSKARATQLERFPYFASLAERIAQFDYERQYAAALDGVIEVLQAHVEARLAASRK